MSITAQPLRRHHAIPSELKFTISAEERLHGEAEDSQPHCNLDMPTAATLRAEIEALLAHRIPSALIPVQQIIRPVVATGIQALDQGLHGGTRA